MLPFHSGTNGGVRTNHPVVRMGSVAVLVAALPAVRALELSWMWPSVSLADWKPAVDNIPGDEENTNEIHSWVILAGCLASTGGLRRLSYRRCATRWRRRALLSVQSAVGPGGGTPRRQNKSSSSKLKLIGLIFNSWDWKCRLQNDAPAAEAGIEQPRDPVQTVIRSRASNSGTSIPQLQLRKPGTEEAGLETRKRSIPIGSRWKTQKKKRKRKKKKT